MKVYVATVFGDGQVSDYHGVGQSPYNGILYTEEEKNKIEAAINAQNATRGIEWHEIECDEQFLKDHKTLSLLIRGYKAESYGAPEYITDFKLYTPEQIEEMKQQGTMLKDGDYLTSWDYESPLYQEKINTIDIAKVGAEIGMEAKEQTLPNGKVVKSLVWDQENLLKAVEAVKHLSEEGKPVRITGAAPAWLVSALTHTVHPCPVGLYMPQIGKDVDIPQLAHGEANPEGEVAFKTTEKGDSILIEYKMDLPEGITTYDEGNLPKVAVPEVPQGKAVYLSGRGPNYLTVAIAEAYAHTNSSVSLFQPGIGYTCSITHSRSKRLGDLTKDPLVKEEVKEQLDAAKEEQAPKQHTEKTTQSKEGLSIDD